MSHVINSHALTGEKPYINKAIHALLMHGYATFNMIVPGPQICCRYEIVLFGPRTSIVRANCVRETSVERRNKIEQEITRNVANVFRFLCNNNDRTWFFNALAFARFLGRCRKPRPPASVFNTSLGTWRILMHDKPCLIPIIKQMPERATITERSKLMATKGRVNSYEMKVVTKERRIALKNSDCRGIRTRSVRIKIQCSNH